MAKQNRNKTETISGIIILVVLVLIGAMIFRRQFEFNPAVEARRALATMDQNADTGAGTLFPISKKLKAMTPVETFTPGTLYEKIDGQADLYLAAGFVQLKSQRYVMTNNPDMWFEAFRYDMGTSDNAFSVYSQQYREEGSELKWTRFAYSVPNALFFVHGQEYIEMRAANTSDELIALMHEMARKYVENNALGKITVAGIGWFPEEGLDSKSVSMVSANAFGFDRLDRVYTAKYTINGKDVTAYISKRSSPEKAAELAEAVANFYLEYGGSELAAGFPSKNGRTVEVMGSIDIMFSRGVYLAGVHEAPDRDAAREMAKRLYEKIGDISSE